MSNRKTGTDFEKELCEILSEHGFWVHNMGQKAAGQPFDIIAVRNDRPLAIDAKVCENDEFPLSRIEENQRNAMLLWRDCGNYEKSTGFALKLSNGDIRLIDHYILIELINFGMKVLKEDDIRRWGINFEHWVELW